MKSALFVDFDNVFSQLRQLQPQAAERFARQPSDWIRWLTDSLQLPAPHAEGQRRRLLVRRCYLNPNWYQTYRHAFLRAGFEIVDCPPVTSQGKTSTDIHLVLDVVDLLQHETRYDEFIVFSADADFTPVLRKLRRYDRRTTVLAIGFPSAAYQASADLLIDERLFVQDALGLGRTSTEAGTVATNGNNGTTPEASEARPAQGRLLAADTALNSVATAAAKTDPSTQRAPRPATPAELSTIATRIWATSEESSLPVSAGLLASRLRQEFPDVTENWNGCTTFKQFFRSLGLSKLMWLSGSGGRVFDPARHELREIASALEPDSPWAGREQMFITMKEACSLTAAPMFAPRELQIVLALLAEELKLNTFEMNSTVRRVCDKCLEAQGLRVRLRDITFLVRGMQLNGHVFGKGDDDQPTLATRLVNQILFLCEREQMALDASAIGNIKRWVVEGPAE